jgi:hypothetical protein
MNRVTHIAVLAGIAAAMSGCGQAHTGGTLDASSTRQPSAAASITIIGGTPAQRDALQTIIGSLKPAGISVIEITSAEGPLAPQGGDELKFTLTPTTSPGAALVEAQWGAYLTAGDFRDSSAANGLPDVSGVALSTGTIVSLASVEHPAVTETTVATQAIVGNLAKMGVSQAAVDTRLVDGRAVVSVRAVADDPAAFVATFGRAALQQTFGDINLYDGTFLLIRSSTGKDVFAAGYASRAAHGLGWSDPSLSTSAPSGVAQPASN